MKDEYFYRILGVIDRIKEEIYLSGYNFCSMSKVLKKDTSTFYHMMEGKCLKIETIYEISKIVNVSFEYFLTGKNKDVFKPFVIDVYNIVKIYDNLPYGKKNLINQQKIYRLKHLKQKDINVSTLLMIADSLKMNVIDILSPSA